MIAKQIVICSDNYIHLKKIPDNYFHSIVTDSPYGLGKEPDPAKVLPAWLDHGYYEVKGGGFMGKHWDSFVPQPIFWKEVFRVLRPGGYCLSFFGTRTIDWGVMAMRLAGFEVRDSIFWVYGEGFPKSIDISKMIDKELNVERPIVGKVKLWGENASGGRAGQNKNEFQKTKVGAVKYADITAPGSPESKQWDGWGSALKPAVEPIIVCRKPLSEKTIVQNVLKWGTGGMNIDASRIEIKDDGGTWGTSNKTINTERKFNASPGMTDYRSEQHPKGRFPANLIIDEEASEIFASRFFYCAKTSQYERERGLGDFDSKKFSQSNGGKAAAKRGEEDAFQGSIGINKTKTVKNDHPTVKPIDLMRYLVRLVTPKGGHCLDPFNGSGTTGIACKLELINYTGIEMDERHCKISEARIKIWSAKDLIYPDHKPQPKVDKDQTKLF